MDSRRLDRLKTGSVITVNFTFPQSDTHVYAMFGPSGFIPIYPTDNPYILYDSHGAKPGTSPLTTHPWETIPSPTGTPPPEEVPIPPPEPIRNPVPTIGYTTMTYSFPSELPIGLAFIVVAVVIGLKKKT